MDKAKVNYSYVSIVQASNLKYRLEGLYKNRDGVTIASVDDINMFPSIKLAIIRKAVRLFARKLTAAAKMTINFFLGFICFGMNSTLISFDSEYYEYHSGKKA